MSARNWGIASTVILGLGFASSAAAEDLWPIEQNLNIAVGGFLVDNKTTIRLDGENNVRGTEVDFDKEFGYDSQSRFRIDGYWRFLERQKLRFMYFSSTVDGSRQIDEEIRYGDVVYPISATVRAGIEIEIAEVAYEYSFLRRENFEVAATIGLHNLSINARLEANAASTGDGIARESAADANGPLPVLGLRGIYAFSDQFYIDAIAQFFALEFDDYDGGLSDVKLSFVWQPLRHVGVGIGYNNFASRLDVEGDRFSGRLKFSYGGPLLFLVGSF